MNNENEKLSGVRNKYFDSTNIVVNMRMAINGLIAQVETVYNTFINIADDFNLEIARNELNKIACDWGFKCIKKNMDSVFKYDNEKYITEFILLSVITSYSRIDIGVTYKYGKLVNGSPVIFINSFARNEVYKDE